ncbi:MAG: AAA family ATPase [Hyphomicrobiales bacterium]|nr:AAA family ATPase [Hyphomicrobiales bacterium]
MTDDLLKRPEHKWLLTKTFVQIGRELAQLGHRGAGWAYRMLGLRPGDRDGISSEMDVAIMLLANAPKDLAVEVGSRVRVWCEIACGERPAYGMDLFAVVQRVVAEASVPAVRTSLIDETPVRSQEYMWLADFVRAHDRKFAWIELADATRDSANDSAIESLIAAAEVNRGAAGALARALDEEHPTLARAWMAYASPPSKALLMAANDLERSIRSSGLPFATIDHSLAYLYAWKKIALGKLGGVDPEIDFFAKAHAHWRDQLPKVARDSTRIRSAVPPPLQLLSFGRWDEAAKHLKKLTAAELDPMDAPVLLAVFAGGDRVEGAQRIRGLVDILFDLGTVEAGELALGWLMLLAAPERPSSVQHVVPQLQHLLDRSVMSEAPKAEAGRRLAVWWDAAAGKYVSQAVSIFQIAHRVLGGGGFQAARKEAMKELAQMDEVDVDPKMLGPSLIVMPKATSTKLDGGHSVHGAFKQLVDRKLPLILARDIGAVRRQLHAEYPHGSLTVDLLLRDLREDKPITLKPILLVGGPGAGKSRLARRLGELLGLYVFRYDGAASLDGMFGGVSKAWSSTQPSAPARAIQQADHANPIVMIDEIEKGASDSSRNGSLHNAMMPFLEAETAKRFRDPSLDAELDLSCVSYIATANDDTTLPLPLKDRFRIIRVPDPTLAHLPALAANVMREMAAADEVRMHDEPLADDELEIIGRAWKRSGMSMRKLQKIVAATLDARDAYKMRH